MIVEQEEEVTRDIAALLAKAEIDIMDKYDDLFAMLVKAQALEFEEDVNGSTISMHWEDSPALIQHASDIEKIRVLVMLKRNFQRGIAAKDELVLGECTDKLTELRSADMCDVAFCSTEQIDAAKIITSAAAFFCTFLGTVEKALSSSSITLTREINATGISELKAEVVVGQLQAVLDDSAEVKSKSVKITLLAQTLEKLRDLRQFCAKSEWRKAFDCVNEDWKHLITVKKDKDNVAGDDAQSAGAGDRRKSFKKTKTERVNIAMTVAAEEQAAKYIFIPAELVPVIDRKSVV